MPFQSPSFSDAVERPEQLSQLLQNTFAQIEAELAKADPVGRINLWPDGIALPEGWVLTDGATYNKTKFPVLWDKGKAVFTSTATTFDVPLLAGPAGFVYIIRVE